MHPMLYLCIKAGHEHAHAYSFMNHPLSIVRRRLESLAVKFYNGIAITTLIHVHGIVTCTNYIMYVTSIHETRPMIGWRFLNANAVIY